MSAPSTAPTPLQVQWVRYGPQAVAALADAIDRAQGDDRLARVTVVVPTKLAGLGLRRRLAGRPEGLAAVAFEVLDQLAERIAAPALAAMGSTPIGPGANAVLVARAARANPGALADLIDRPATLTALHEAVTDLRAIPHPNRPTAWDALTALDHAVPGIHSTLADIARHHDGLLRERHHDGHDLLARAATVPGDDIAAAVGHLVVHLPVTMTPLGADFLDHVVARAPTTIILGTTGDPTADAHAAETMRRWIEDPDAQTPPRDAARPPAPDVVVVPDAEEEVRHVARELTAVLHAGGDLARMQVLWTRAVPYASLATELFAAAGLPCNGPSTTTLGHTIVGRTLRGLVTWLAEDLPRQGLVDLLATVPARHAGAPVPAAEWSAVARAANVLGGLDHWDARLAGHADELVEQAARAPDRRAARLRDEAHHARTFRTFTLTLHDSLAALPTTWAGWGSWASDLLDQVLGRRRGHWPDIDREAEGQVGQALEALADLDRLCEPNQRVPRWQFLQWLDERLGVSLGRVGTVGTGVRLGPLHSAGHLDAARTWILGAIEGALPARPGRRSFLDDATVQRLRDAGADGPATSLDRQVRDRHALARVRAGGGRTTLMVPRIDRRAGRPTRPGPWVLDLLGGRDRPVAVDDVLDPAAAHDLPVSHVLSAVAGVADAHTPAGVSEWRRQTLLAAVDDGLDLASHPVARSVDGLSSGVQAQRARAGPDFTPWDGNLAAVAQVVAELAARPQSPAALAQYGQCPRRWLLHQGLRLRGSDEPRLWHDVDALDRGRLVHDTLEAWVAQVHGLDDGPPTLWDQATPDPQDEDGAALLTTLFAQRAARLEDTGRVSASSTFWQLERHRLLQLLHVWHQQHKLLVERGHRPVAVEWSFGLDGTPALEVPTTAGITFRMRGRVDRIDVDGAGHVVVWDYKTGAPGRARRGVTDIADQGTQLQLATYALAAVRLRGAAQVEVGYWHVHGNAPAQPTALPLVGEQRARIDEVFDTIAAGMTAGMFAANPGREQMFPRMSHEHCAWCPFDRICPSHGQRAAAARRDWSSPAAAVLEPLAQSRVLGDDQ